MNKWCPLVCSYHARNLDSRAICWKNVVSQSLPPKQGDSMKTGGFGQRNSWLSRSWRSWLPIGANHGETGWHQGAGGKSTSSAHTGELPVWRAETQTGVTTQRRLHFIFCFVLFCFHSWDRERQSPGLSQTGCRACITFSNYKPEPGLSKNGSLARPICGLKLAPANPQQGALTPLSVNAHMHGHTHTHTHTHTKLHFSHSSCGSIPHSSEDLSSLLSFMWLIILIIMGFVFSSLLVSFEITPASV